MCQFVSAVFGADVFALLPLAQQEFVRRGAGAAKGDALDAVAAEMAEVLPLLAPCGQQAHFGEIAQRDGLDLAAAGVAVLVGVADDEAAVFAQGLADGGKGADFCFAVLRRGADGKLRVGGGVGQPRRQHAADFGERVFGGLGEGRLGVPRCPAYADDDGFQLALAEHQRRQLAVVAVQLVADACFAANVCALRAQGVDVAVERARADAQLGGKLGGGGGAFAAVAQDVEQLEQAGGFGHGGQILGRYCRGIKSSPVFSGCLITPNSTSVHHSPYSSFSASLPAAANPAQLAEFYPYSHEQVFAPHYSPKPMPSLN